MNPLHSLVLYPTLIYKEPPKTAESGQATIWQPSGNTGSSACTHTVLQKFKQNGSVNVFPSAIAANKATMVQPQAPLRPQPCQSGQ